MTSPTVLDNRLSGNFKRAGAFIENTPELPHCPNQRDEFEATILLVNFRKKAFE